MPQPPPPPLPPPPPPPPSSTGTTYLPAAPIPRYLVAPFQAAWERHAPQDSAVCHPVFFTPRLTRASRQQQQQQHPPPSAMTNPVAHGYVYQTGTQRAFAGTPKL